MTRDNPPVQSAQPPWNARLTVRKCVLISVAAAIASNWLIHQLDAQWCLLYVFFAVCGAIETLSSAAVIRLGVFASIVFGISNAAFFAYLFFVTYQPIEGEGVDLLANARFEEKSAMVLFILPYAVLPTLPFAFFGAAAGYLIERRRREKNARLS